MKKSCIVLGVIGLSVSIMLLTQAKRNPKPKEFSIYHTVVFQNGDTRDVYASVIVHVDDYDMEEMFDQVQYEHNLINEAPDKLTIRLYDSKEALKAGDCKGEKVYSD